MYSRPWQRTVSCLAAMSHDRADAASFIRSSSAIEHMRLSAPGLNAVEQSIVMNSGKAVRLCEPRDFRQYVYISSGINWEQMMNDRGRFLLVLLLISRYRYSTSHCSTLVSRKSSRMIRFVFASLFRCFTYFPVSSATLNEYRSSAIVK